MDMPALPPQSLATHRRFDPLFHFFALPVIGLSVIAAIVHAVQRPTWFAAWLVLLSLALVIVTLRARMYALRVQDRLIRLEERLRLNDLIAEPLRSRICELSEGQLIALRFASDAEVPGLVQAALAKQLSKAEIKKSITSWRGDYFRV
jgi:Family of unknown function (DUF6526)